MMQARSGLHTTGHYEVRSGRCPVCDTLFDDAIKPPQGNYRYCPKCNGHKLGTIKRTGTIVKK